MLWVVKYQNILLSGGPVPRDQMRHEMLRRSRVNTGRLYLVWFQRYAVVQFGLRGAMVLKKQLLIQFNQILSGNL